jgi:hypothetical protein
MYGTRRFGTRHRIVTYNWFTQIAVILNMSSCDRFSLNWQHIILIYWRSSWVDPYFIRNISSLYHVRVSAVLNEFQPKDIMLAYFSPWLNGPLEHVLLYDRGPYFSVVFCLHLFTFSTRKSFSISYSHITQTICITFYRVLRFGAEENTEILRS